MRIDTALAWITAIMLLSNAWLSHKTERLLNERIDFLSETLERLAHHINSEPAQPPMPVAPDDTEFLPISYPQR